MTTPHTPTRIAVVSAGLRAPSTTRSVAEAIARELRGAGDEVDLPVIDLRDHAHAVVDALLTGFPAGPLVEVVEQTYAADALVVVTPTFAGSYAGLLKSFVDILEPDRLRGKPVLLAATGGTERHSLMLEFALRPLVVQVGLRPVPTAVFAATADFASGAEGGLAARIRRAAGELVDALSGHREQTSPDPFAQVTPFADLLR
ncbi:MAG: CE1759 family FMN reductase [Propioniciclava sp.]